MNVSFENTDKVSGLLTIKLEKADYQEQVNKELKKARQAAQMPGFRKGMVPMSLVQKMYGKGILAQVIDKMLSDKLYDYIKENKLDVLGEPLSNEDKQKPIDFDTMEDFEFMFDIALAPQFDLEVSDKDTVDFYDINVDDKLIDEQMTSFKQRYGKYEKATTYSDKDRDMLKGLLAELDENGNTKEGGIQVEKASLLPAFMKNDDQKAKFTDAKVNDVIVFNPNAAYDNSETEVASLLKVDKKIAAELKSDFSFQVEEITHFVPAELNQELFDEVYGKDAVKSEEEFRAKVKEQLSNSFLSDVNYRFMIDARTMLMNKVGKLEYPDALLKRVMLNNNKDKGADFVDQNYDKSIEELTWHLIKSKLASAFDLKVNDDEVKQMAKLAVQSQFAQYGMSSVPEDLLVKYSEEMLKKPESRDGLIDRVVENKIGTALQAKVKLDKKTVSLEEFNKLFEEKNA